MRDFEVFLRRFDRSASACVLFFIFSPIPDRWRQTTYAVMPRRNGIGCRDGPVEGASAPPGGRLVRGDQRGAFDASAVTAGAIGRVSIEAAADRRSA
jgi:hypothetical protein